MISYAEAQNLLKTLHSNFPIEKVSLSDAAGRILAEPIKAPFDSPRFTNSAMDGYAFKRQDLAKFPDLKISSTRFADELTAVDSTYEAGVCMKIMTGAPVPRWADTVVPVEHTKVIDGGLIKILNFPDQGANIRVKGVDITEGTNIYSSGTYLSPEAVMIAANFGIQELAVKAKPRVLLISTGNELRELGDSLPAGTIYNSSKYFLASALKQQYGLKPELMLTISDEPETATSILEPHIETDAPSLVITTGAVSAGEKDFIPALAADLGFEQVFHKVAVRPGKPVFLARRRNILWMGIPGNPISTATSWHFFVRPLLSHWAGYPLPEFEKACISGDLKKPADLRCFFRGHIDGKLATVHNRQGSAEFLASLTSNAYIVLNEGEKIITHGTEVDVLRI
jgi:molybdopterin molybdotransferase